MSESHEAWKRWRSCESKAAYPRRSWAESVAKRTPKKAGKRAKAYRCNYCESYHVGHDLSNRAKDSAKMIRYRLTKRR